MTNNNYGYFKSEITGLYTIQDKKGKKTFSGMEDEYNCKRIVNLLNKKDERIKELKQNNDMKFWKHHFMEQHNRTQLIIHELGIAIRQGYETSDEFKKYLEELKQSNEKTMQKAIEQDQW